MKYELQTIPAWDAVKKNSECPLCLLMKQAEEDSVAYYLGSSVMNPETRVQVNKIGFCPVHFDMLAQAKKPQSLAVMLRSYLDTSLNELQKSFNQAQNSKQGRQTNKAIDSINQSISLREQGCLICEKMQQRLLRYCYTFAVLYTTDVEFQKALDESKGFCLYHLKDLLDIAKQSLDSKSLNFFLKQMIALEERSLKKIGQDLEWMTQKYKSENADKPFNGCEDAHKRTTYKLIGIGRTK